MNASPNPSHPLHTATTSVCPGPLRAGHDTVPACWRSECFAEDLAPAASKLPRRPGSRWASLAGFAIPLASSLLAAAVMTVERVG